MLRTEWKGIWYRVLYLKGHAQAFVNLKELSAQLHSSKLRNAPEPQAATFIHEEVAPEGPAVMSKTPAAHLGPGWGKPTDGSTTRAMPGGPAPPEAMGLHDHGGAHSTALVQLDLHL